MVNINKKLGSVRLDDLHARRSFERDPSATEGNRQVSPVATTLIHLRKE